jgi:hypothetical protein
MVRKKQYIRSTRAKRLIPTKTLISWYKNYDDDDDDDDDDNNIIIIIIIIMNYLTTSLLNYASRNVSKHTV